MYFFEPIVLKHASESGLKRSFIVGIFLDLDSPALIGCFLNHQLVLRNVQTFRKSSYSSAVGGGSLH